MILVAGLSPAWQRIMQFDRFQPGEVNRAQSVHDCASGKVINVALALRHLEAACEAVTVLGGSSGRAIEDEMTGLGIRLGVVRLSLPTRVCTTILDTATGQTTELVENAASITSDIVDQFRGAFLERAATADWMIGTGSLPPGTPTTIFRELFAERGDRTILDIRGPELLDALQIRPLLVKPNRHELEYTLGRALNSDCERLEAMQELRARGAQWVVITDGTGSLRIAGPEGNWQAMPVRVTTANPIGCGDCFTAGVTARLARGDAMLEAIRYGVAAAADNAAQLLPGRLDPARVAKLAEQVRIDRTG